MDNTSYTTSIYNVVVAVGFNCECNGPDQKKTRLNGASFDILLLDAVQHGFYLVKIAVDRFAASEAGKPGI